MRLLEEFIGTHIVDNFDKVLSVSETYAKLVESIFNAVEEVARDLHE